MKKDRLSNNGKIRIKRIYELIYALMENGMRMFNHFYLPNSYHESRHIAKLWTASSPNLPQSKLVKKLTRFPALH